MIKKIGMWILIALGMFFLVAFVGGWIFSAPGHKGEVTDHFDGTRFTNPNDVVAKGFGDLIKFLTNRKPGPWQSRMGIPPGEKPSAQSDSLLITYVNHSTFLIQVDGLNILTDPIWSKRTSPMQWLGPKRTRPPGVRFEDLPDIDLVIISHNHYDHLDRNTLQRISQEHNPHVVAPLGVGKYLTKIGMKRVTELDWWQSDETISSVEVTSVPAQHFSGRGMMDRDKTLWAGYVLSTSTGSIYFAGDTGYSDTMFKEIGDRFPNITSAMIPIGAYKPEWFMSPIHVSPEEAVKIHLDTRAKVSMGMHFNTFPLADDGMLEPVDDLKKALQIHGVPPDQFVVLEEGIAYSPGN